MGNTVGDMDLIDFKELGETRKRSLNRRGRIGNEMSLPDSMSPNVEVKEPTTTIKTPVDDTTYDTVQNMADERASGIFGKDVKQYTSAKPELKTKSKKLQALMRILGL